MWVESLPRQTRQLPLTESGWTSNRVRVISMVTWGSGALDLSAPQGSSGVPEPIHNTSVAALEEEGVNYRTKSWSPLLASWAT